MKVRKRKPAKRERPDRIGPTDVATPEGSKGGLLRALRASPLVGAGLDLKRLRPRMRKIEL
jgi:hypothetical protein